MTPIPASTRLEGWGLFFVKPKAALCGPGSFGKSVVDLTFDAVSPQVLTSKAKSGTTLESNILLVSQWF
jgi:hypothetical protein